MAVYDSRAASLVKSATTRFRNALRYHLEKKCREIEIVIDEGSIRELTSIFPRLIDNIFGLNYQNDWGLKVLTRSLSLREFQVFRNFLSPEGTIFDLIYKLMGDASIRFDFPVAFLPAQTRKQFEEGIIPMMYVNKLQKYPGQIATTVSLNPFEYYMFHFANYLVNPYNLKVVISNWTVPSEALYPTIVDDYLNYFLPTDESVPLPVNVSISPRSITPSKSPPQYVSPVRQFRLLKNQEILQSPVTSLKQNECTRLETWRSEITAQIFAEMWLKQNTHEHQGMNILSAHGQEPFVVNLDHMRTLHMRIRTSIRRLQSNVVSQVIQKKFYLFLQTSITFWPLDASFRLVLETWLSYIQPWRYVSYGRNHGSFGRRREERELVDTSWQRFVMENIAFYSILFQRIVLRFFRMELSTSKNAYMLYRITKVYSQSNLKQLIATAERNLFEPLNRLSEMRSPAFDESGFNCQPVINPGMVAAVRQQLIDLEKPGFQYVQLFSEEVKCQMQQLLSLINQARDTAQEQCVVYDNSKVGFFTKLGRAISSLIEGGSFGDEYAIHDACKITTYLLTVSEQLAKIFDLSHQNLNISETGDTAVRTQAAESTTTLPRTPLSQQSKPNVSFQGNPDLQPIRSYEVKFLVRWFYQLSTFINDKYRIQLRRYFHRTDFTGHVCKQVLAAPIIYYQYDKSTFPPTRLQKVLPARVNLRPLAHKQLFCYYIALCVISLLWGEENVIK
uniref:Sphingomyelin phosphodiesterase 4 n=1 Tax=Strigamia maritima TaxID=126957 RepID=T1INQ4_STRMM